MIHRVIYVAGWVYDILFAIEKYDIDGVLGCLYDCGAPAEIMDQAVGLMEDNIPNRGFTFTNPFIRRGLVVIGPSDRGSQSINTIVHEIRHVADGIAKSLGVPLDSETPAYMSGDIAMELADIICVLGCGC